MNECGRVFVHECVHMSVNVSACVRLCVPVCPCVFGHVCFMCVHVCLDMYCARVCVYERV